MLKQNDNYITSRLASKCAMELTKWINPEDVSPSKLILSGVHISDFQIGSILIVYSSDKIIVILRLYQVDVKQSNIHPVSSA